MSKKILLTSIGVTVAFMALYAYFSNLTKESPEPEELGGDTAQNNMNNNLTETKNFKISEFSCHDGTPVPTMYYGNVSQLMKNLQVLRNRTGLPIFITSGYRTPEHNAKIGGAHNSCHLTAKAADIKIPGMSPKEVKNLIEMLIADGIMDQGGIGLYPTWVHYDVRGTKARW
jgi:hypothetical protein